MLTVAEAGYATGFLTKKRVDWCLRVPQWLLTYLINSWRRHAMFAHYFCIHHLLGIIYNRLIVPST